MNHTNFRFTLLGILLGLTSVSFLPAQIISPFPTLSANAAPPEVAPAPKLDSADTLKASYQDLKEGRFDEALTDVNGLIAADAKNRPAHLIRASIYAKLQQWDKASSDYDAVVAIYPNDNTAKFDQAELKFMQKKYSEARVGFAGISGDPNLADFATYKVFLCDLFSGNEDAASKDLDAINQVGGNPSYYFANAAWDLAHNKPQDAADWLKSANWIYANVPEKCLRYSASLQDHGYLPLHLSSTQ